MVHAPAQTCTGSKGSPAAPPTLFRRVTQKAAQMMKQKRVTYVYQLPSCTHEAGEEEESVRTRA